MKFTVKNKRHARFENGQLVIYQVGDIIDATPEEAKAFADKLEPVVEVLVTVPADEGPRKAKKASKAETAPEVPETAPDQA